LNVGRNRDRVVLLYYGRSKPDPAEPQTKGIPQYLN
jgi:hypothetical protein